MILRGVVMRKRIVMAVFAAILILVSLGSCSRCSDIQPVPNDQTYTKWESEDGRIVFYVDGERRFFGTIAYNGQNIAVYASIPMYGGEMYIFPILIYDGSELIGDGTTSILLIQSDFGDINITPRQKKTTKSSLWSKRPRILR